MKPLAWMARNNSCKWPAITQGAKFYTRISWAWVFRVSASTGSSLTRHFFMFQPRSFHECSRSFRVASRRVGCSSVRIHMAPTGRDGQTTGTVVLCNTPNGDGLWSRLASLSWSITTDRLESPGNFSPGLLRFGASYSLDRIVWHYSWILAIGMMVP